MNELKKLSESELNDLIRRRLKRHQNSLGRFCKEETGLPYPRFLKYLRSTYKKGMTDSNRGTGYLTEMRYDEKQKRKIQKLILDENGNSIPVQEWQIDHVISLSCIIKCCKKFEIRLRNVKPNFYRNLRAEWATQNSRKEDKILIRSKKKIMNLLSQIFHKQKGDINKIYDFLLEKKKIKHMIEKDNVLFRK